MPKYAALFSGQGSQYPGMGKELWEAHPRVKKIYECAGDLLGFDVMDLSVRGPEEKMMRTLYAQPLIFTHSMACFEAAKERLPAPDAVAGHSLGEFAALCCAGAFSLEDGFRIIGARAQAMDKVAGGAMAACMVSDPGVIEAACRDAGGYVVPVNFNQPGQTVIAGDEDAVTRAAAILEEGGARTVRLGVSAAFHTKLMEPAAQAFSQAVKDIPFTAPRLDFYSNLTGARHVPDDFPAYFARHMVSPVRFVEQMAAMAGDGVEICVEFGPKKTAATLAKKNVRTFAVGNVEDLKSLEKAAGLF